MIKGTRDTYRWDVNTMCVCVRVRNCYVWSNQTRQIGQNAIMMGTEWIPIPALPFWVVRSCSADGSFQRGIKMEQDHDDRFSLCACVYMQSFILQEVLWPCSTAYKIVYTIKVASQRFCRKGFTSMIPNIKSSWEEWGFKPLSWISIVFSAVGASLLCQFTPPLPFPYNLGRLFWRSKLLCTRI